MLKPILLSVTLSLAVLTAAQAQTIATVDAQGIVNQTNAAQRAMKSLQKKTDEAQTEIDAMEAKISKQQETLEKKKGVVSESAFLDEQDKLRKSLREYRNKAQAIQEDIDRENMKLRKEITDVVRNVVEEIAKEKGYEAVIAHSLLLYSKENIDISDEVLKRANQKLDK